MNEVILTHELKRYSLNIEREVPVSSKYDKKKFGEGCIIRNDKRRTQIKSICVHSVLCARISNLKKSLKSGRILFLMILLVHSAISCNQIKPHAFSQCTR